MPLTLLCVVLVASIASSTFHSRISKAVAKSSIFIQRAGSLPSRKASKMSLRVLPRVTVEPILGYVLPHQGPRRVADILMLRRYVPKLHSTPCNGHTHKSTKPMIASLSSQKRSMLPLGISSFLKRVSSIQLFHLFFSRTDILLQISFRRLLERLRLLLLRSLLNSNLSCQMPSRLQNELFPKFYQN